MKSRRLIMIKFKRFIAALLCAILGAMSLVLAACSGGTDTGRGLENVVNDIEFDEYGDPIFDNINLKVWSVIGKPDNAYYSVINGMFNDYYRVNGLKATVTEVDVSAFYTQLAQTLNTDPDNAPDVVLFHSERLQMLASQNILMPMNTFYEALGDHNTFATSNYVDSVIQQCYYNDKLYGVPLDVHSGVWYCRQDIIERNGLQVPHTLSQFVAVNNALIDLYKNDNLWIRSLDNPTWRKVGRTGNDAFGASYEPVVMSSVGGIETGWIPQTAVVQNGGTITAANGNPAWNTEGLKDVMEMFRDWQKGTGSFKGTEYSGKFVATNSDANTTWSNLASGQSVFCFEGPWYCADRFNEYNEALSERTDGSPTGEKYSPLTIINPSKMFALDEDADCADKVYGVGHCISVVSTVKSLTRCVAAALYAQYVTENSAEYMQGGHMPANKAVLASDKFKAIDGYDEYLKLMGNPENFVMLGDTKHYGAVYECLKGVYADVFSSTNQSVSVQTIINSRYNEAIGIINANVGL